MAIGVLETRELTDAQFERISVLVKSLCGINLHSGKKELVKARLGKRLHALNLSSFEEYIDYVERDATRDELTTMLDSISTNLTHFFREPKHFEHLAKSVLSAWKTDGGSRGKPLRIWSAGCSSGEEPYSIAILLHEEVPHIGGADVKVLATDLSTRVLARAKQGIYDAERLRDVPGHLISKYFACVETRPPRRYQVNPNVRRLVHFARLNLMEAWPMRGPFNVIFCRNVMIYFDKPTQGRLINRFWEILGPNGVLFLGHSESLTGVQHRFAYVQPTVYRKS